MKKNIIIILILVLIYGLIMFILLRNNNSSEEDNPIYYKEDSNKYLVINNESRWLYKNNKWSNTSTNSIEKSSNHYKVYDDNNYLGEYKLQYGNNWNVFNDNSEFIDYKGSLFAYTNNFDIKLIRFNANEINKEIQKIIIDKYGNKDFDNLVTDELINVDIDNNGQIDKIICLSNYNELEDSKNYYNLVFIVLNDNYYTVIDQNKNNSNVYELPIYKINRLFIYDNETYLVVEETYGMESDSPSIKNILYKLVDNQFKKVIND